MQNEQDATSYYEMVKIRADQLSLENEKFPTEWISTMVTNSQLLAIMKIAAIFTVLNILQWSIM